MANAIPLPSGAYRTQATKTINGKKITKSFTVHPKDCGGNANMAKKLSELSAKEWQLQAEVEENTITVSKCLAAYIADREEVLSPVTIYEYRHVVPSFDSIKDMTISEITSIDIQKLIRDWYLDFNLSAKTIRKRISFLLSALKHSGCEKKFYLQYPITDSKLPKVLHERSFRFAMKKRNL